MRVIEIYGDYWHSQGFCESKGLPEYKWNAEVMVEEYAKVGVFALIFWESELRGTNQREGITESLRLFVSEGES